MPITCGPSLRVLLAKGNVPVDQHFIKPARAMLLRISEWARTALRSAGLALPPIRRLHKMRDALIAERNTLLTQLAATEAALAERTEQLTTLRSRTTGKCCLYTAYDQGFARVAAYTVPAMRRYAELYGFDFDEHVDPIRDRPIAWSKIYIAREKFAKGYDTIFWLDADAKIRRFDEDIRDHIDSDHEFYFVKEQFHEAVKSRLNSGLFVMRRSEIADRFLDAVLSRTELTNHVWWEQAAILATFGLWSNFDDHLRRADEPNEFSSRLKFLPPRWNSFMGKDCDPDAIVHHFIILDNHGKAAALAIDAIFDQMGPRDAAREEQFRSVISQLFTMIKWDQWAKDRAGVEVLSVAEPALAGSSAVRKEDHKDRQVGKIG